MINRKKHLHVLPNWFFGANLQRLVRYGIIGAVFALSLLLALQNNQRLLFMVLALLIAGAGAIILIRRLPLGLLFIVISAFFVPSLSQSGAGAKLLPPIVLVVALFGLWVFDMIVRQRQIQLIRSRTLLPAVIFVLISIIAFVNGQINYYSLAQNAPVDTQLAGLAVFLISIIAFLLVAHVVDDIKWLERLTWLFLGLGGVYVFGRILPVLENLIRPFFQYGSDASLFWIWMVAMAASQALFNNQIGRRARFALYAVLALTIYVGIVLRYEWKSGWLPGLVALAVIVWIGMPRFRVSILVLAGVALLLNVIMNFSRVFSGGEDYSILTRVEAWRIVLEIVKVNPVLGLGLSNYYWYTPLIPILGYSSRFSSHNNYIDLIAQTGIIGLACFLWLAWEIGRLGWTLRSEAPEGFSKAFVIGVLGGLAGTLVAGMLGDWILPFVYNVGLIGMRSSLFAWIFLGGLVAMEQIIRGRPTSIHMD